MKFCEVSDMLSNLTLDYCLSQHKTQLGFKGHVSRHAGGRSSRLQNAESKQSADEEVLHQDSRRSPRDSVHVWFVLGVSGPPGENMSLKNVTLFTLFPQVCNTAFYHLLHCALS